MKKEKALIFGAGATGESLLAQIQEHYNVVAFVDNDSRKWNECLCGIEICSPESIANKEFDAIFIGTYLGDNDVLSQLLDMGVERNRIHKSDNVAIYEKARLAFLRNLAAMFNEMNIKGAVAEGGVFRGEFAKEINSLFPTRRLYLFDTFEGFDARDIAIEKQHGYSKMDAGHFGITHEDIVLKNMPYPDMCIVCKGYFPETTTGINDKFCFVNLDFDLYQPMIAGIEYFYPIMVNGGVILVNDYFYAGYRGAKQALDDFAAKNSGIKMSPIGDGLSIAICC